MGPGHAPQETLVEAAIAHGVRDQRVLRTVSRAGFVPAELASRAYSDRPLPIGYDQVTSQPSLGPQRR